MRTSEPEVRRVLLGRPVHFDGEDDAFAESRLRKAAELAGFEEVHFLAEPVAAARAFGAAADREELALIGDFGGGTSDFTVLRMGPRALRREDVLAVGGVAVAGDALDASLMRAQVGRHFGAEVRYRAPFGTNVLRMPQGDRAAPLLARAPLHAPAARHRELPRRRAPVVAVRGGPPDRMDQLTALVEETQGFHLFEAIERAKRELSSESDAEIVFSHPGIEVREPVTRAGFEEASRREVDEILRCLDETVRAAGVGFGDIGVVCCTGGTAQGPADRRRDPAAATRGARGAVQGVPLRGGGARAGGARDRAQVRVRANAI